MYINTVDKLDNVILELEDIIRLSIGNYRKELNDIYNSIEAYIDKLLRKNSLEKSQSKLKFDNTNNNVDFVIYDDDYTSIYDDNKRQVYESEEELFVIIHPKKLLKEDSSSTKNKSKYLIQVNRSLNYLKYKAK